MKLSIFSEIGTGEISSWTGKNRETPGNLKTGFEWGPCIGLLVTSQVLPLTQVWELSLNINKYGYFLFMILKILVIGLSGHSLNVFILLPLLLNIDKCGYFSMDLNIGILVT